MKGYIECDIGGVADFSFPTSTLRRGRVQGGGQICPTLQTGEPMICRIERNEDMTEELNDEVITYRIRKLTANECWRLMGFTDEDFHKAETVNSNTQLYKEAGNSIVVPVLMAIFSQLHIKGVTPWNDLSEKERVDLIERTTRDWETS